MEEKERGEVVVVCVCGGGVSESKGNGERKGDRETEGVKKKEKTAREDINY